MTCVMCKGKKIMKAFKENQQVVKVRCPECRGAGVTFLKCVPFAENLEKRN